MKRHGIYIIALLIILLAVINTVSAEDTNIDLIADNSNNDNVNINATDSVLKSSNEDCQFVSENSEDNNTLLNENSLEDNTLKKVILQILIQKHIN